MTHRLTWWKFILGLVFFWVVIPILIIKNVKNLKLKCGLVTGWIVFLLFSITLSGSNTKNNTVTGAPQIKGVSEKVIQLSNTTNKDEEEKENAEEVKKQQEIVDKQQADKKAEEDRQKQEAEKARAESENKVKAEKSELVRLRSAEIEKSKKAVNAPQSNTTVSNNCNPSYPSLCIPLDSPELDCKDISQNNFVVLQPDRHRLDGDKDEVGCESKK